MTSRYVVLPSADRDLDDRANYYIEAGGLELGLRFLAAASGSFSMLAKQPRMGWRCKLANYKFVNIRVFRVQGFEKTLIFYRPLRGRIEIIRVLAGMRDLELPFEKDP